jgi:hypothetical protein
VQIWSSWGRAGEWDIKKHGGTCTSIIHCKAVQYTHPSMLSRQVHMLCIRRYTNGNLLAVMDSCGKLGFDGEHAVYG